MMQIIDKAKSLTAVEEIMRRCEWIETDLYGLSRRHPESAAVACIVGRACMLLAEIVEFATKHL